jgi:hypothetical protein
MWSPALKWAVACALLAGCSVHPLGIPSSEWASMTHEQRMQAHALQLERDQAAAERRALEASARQAEAARLEASARQAEAARLEAERAEIRARTSYGERIQCVLRDMEGYLNRKWRPAQDIALDMVVGVAEGFSVEARRTADAGLRRVGHASFDGLAIQLCPGAGGSSTRQCARVVATLQEYRTGVVNDVVVADLLRARMRCDLVPPLPGVRQR